MHIVVGVLIALMGLFLLLGGPKRAAVYGSRKGERFSRSNALAYRAIGGVLILVRVVYATGVWG